MQFFVQMAMRLRCLASLLGYLHLDSPFRSSTPGLDIWYASSQPTFIFSTHNFKSTELLWAEFDIRRSANVYIQLGGCLSHTRNCHSRAGRVGIGISSTAVHELTNLILVDNSLVKWWAVSFLFYIESSWIPAIRCVYRWLDHDDCLVDCNVSIHPLVLLFPGEKRANPRKVARGSHSPPLSWMESWTFGIHNILLPSGKHISYISRCPLWPVSSWEWKCPAITINRFDWFADISSSLFSFTRLLLLQSVRCIASIIIPQFGRLLDCIYRRAGDASASTARWVSDTIRPWKQWMVRRHCLVAEY